MRYLTVASGVVKKQNFFPPDIQGDNGPHDFSDLAFFAGGQKHINQENHVLEEILFNSTCWEKIKSFLFSRPRGSSGPIVRMRGRLSWPGRA